MRNSRLVIGCRPCLILTQDRRTAQRCLGCVRSATASRPGC